MQKYFARAHEPRGIAGKSRLRLRGLRWKKVTDVTRAFQPVLATWE
jgi:hypothetical protein